MSNIKDEMAKVIEQHINAMKEMGIQQKRDAQLIAQAILDMPEIKALVDAVNWFLTDNSDSGKVHAIYAMNHALAPFTAKENE